MLQVKNFNNEILGEEIKSMNFIIKVHQNIISGYNNKKIFIDNDKEQVVEVIFRHDTSKIRYGSRLYMKTSKVGFDKRKFREMILNMMPNIKYEIEVEDFRNWAEKINKKTEFELTGSC